MRRFIAQYKHETILVFGQLHDKLMYLSRLPDTYYYGGKIHLVSYMDIEFIRWLD